MENTTTSKKALKGLINDSMRDAIGRLSLPEPSKKVKKLLYRNAKKLASVYADMMKRDEKKKKRAERKIEDVAKKPKKSKKLKIESQVING
jgi:phage pi2 protein 07